MDLNTLKQKEEAALKAYRTSTEETVFGKGASPKPSPKEWNDSECSQWLRSLNLDSHLDSLHKVGFSDGSTFFNLGDRVFYELVVEKQLATECVQTLCWHRERLLSAYEGSRPIVDRTVPYLKKNEFQIRSGPPLGKGAFGEVVGALWTKDDGFQGVAIKHSTIPQSAWNEGAGVTRMVNELHFLWKMSSLNNVVQLHGYYRDGDFDGIELVMELLDGGSLQNHLQTQTRIGGHLTTKLQLRIARDIAKGMAAVASKGVIHRDLSLRNVLTSKDFSKIRVTDFGLALDLPEGVTFAEYQGEVDLPYRWTAPECLKEKRVFSEKSDVWSFGVTVWELLSYGREFWPEIDNVLNYMMKVEVNKERLPKPAGCPDALYQLMMQCWDSEPEKRPTFSEIVVVLDRILAARAHEKEEVQMVDADQILADPPKAEKSDEYDAV